MVTIRRILLPTDFSPQAGRAREYAIEFAVKFGAELHLLHVIKPMATPSLGVPDYGYIESPAMVTELEQSSRDALEAVLDREFAANHPVTTQVRIGTPLVEILSYADEFEIDLIVMGTLGRTGLSHLLMGSVAENVVQKAKCAVLTIHPLATTEPLPVPVESASLWTIEPDLQSAI
jgi:universal stress protein A